MNFIFEFWYNEGAQILLVLPLAAYALWADRFYNKRYADSFAWVNSLFFLSLMGIAYFGPSDYFNQFDPPDSDKAVAFFIGLGATIGAAVLSYLLALLIFGIGRLLGFLEGKAGVRQDDD